MVLTGLFMKQQHTAKTAGETITGHMDILRNTAMSKLCKHGVPKENICMECEVGPIPKKAENISDHYAYTL